MGRTIIDIDVRDVEKRKIPSKHYVYMVYVTWSDNSTNVIYRRYSRFFDFQSEVLDMFPEEAGTIDPENRIIPFLPGKKFFGRSHIREVAEKRLGPISEYCKQLLKLPKKISQCKEVLDFFELDPDDINPPKGKKASLKAKKISNPKPLEVFIATSEYKKQDKGEISLQVGVVVEVVEKTETGWWFVNVEEEQGWVPSTCLEREDGTKEESAVTFRPGEEQYLCTEEFKGQGEDEISLERGAVVDVLEKNLEGWWKVRYNEREGYAPATYLMKCEGFKIRKHQKTQRSKAPVQKAVSTGPQIVKSLHEVSDLLNEGIESPDTAVRNDTHNQIDDEFDYDSYDLPEEDKIYSINELSKILKEDNRGSVETDQVYESINAIKSRSLKRRGSVKPPPRPTMKPKKGKSSLGGDKPALMRLESHSKVYVTVCDFSNHVGDGISFKAGQHVKVLEKNESGWWFIEFDNNEGWAPASYIEESCGQTTPKLTVADDKQRPKSPVPTSPLPKSPFSSSREDLTDQDEQPSSPKRLSAVGDLASALKAKLKPKGQGPPRPPKKDFLDEEPDTKNNENELVKSQNEKRDSRISSSAPLKPGLGTKALNRGMLNPPPPPPAVGKPTTKDEKTESVSKNKPITPSKLKQNTQSSEILNKANDENSQPGKVNVSGLSGALKARFEGLESDKEKSELPNISQKPETSSKPASKPVQKKPEVPSTFNKPKDIKPQPFNKPTVGFKPPAASNKPSWAKPDRDSSANAKPDRDSSANAKPDRDSSANAKPSWVKQDNDSDKSKKPPWVKPNNDSKSNERASWLKSDNNSDVSKKAPWVKPNNDSKSNERASWLKSDNDSDVSKKAPWVKPNNDSKSNERASWLKSDNDSDVSKKAPWVKPNNDSKSNERASWLKSDNDSDVSKKPPWASPKKDSKPTEKPSWVKSDKNKDESENGNTTPKVSDIASVLKAKFENKISNNSESNVDSSPPPKPKSVNKPMGKPGNPQTSPESHLRPLRPANKFPGKPSTPVNIEKKMNPNKYLSRPLPPKPQVGKSSKGDSDNIHDTKPLPGVPRKPKAPAKGFTDTKSDSDSDEHKPMGVSGLANALKSKLGAKVNDDTSSGVNTKPLPGKPTKPKVTDKFLTSNSGNTNVNTDVENNNNQAHTKCDTMYRAIADHVASNDGEINLSVGLEVELIEKADGWWFVSSDSAEGWAPSDYLEIVKGNGAVNSKPSAVPKTLKAKTSVFRACSNFDAEHEGEISLVEGQGVNVVDKADEGWWFVNIDGNEGWVPASYLEEE